MEWLIHVSGGAHSSQLNERRFKGSSTYTYTAKQEEQTLTDDLPSRAKLERKKKIMLCLLNTHQSHKA